MPLIEEHLQNGFAPHTDIVVGLRETPARIPCKYLYDSLGSTLFESICHLPEYYITRIEADIVDEYIADIVDTIGPGVTLIEPGAGNCRKAARLIPLLRPNQYVPIDISAEFLENAANSLRMMFPHLPILPLYMDICSTLKLPATVGSTRRLFFYPGSSLGNLDPAESLIFLRRFRTCLQPHDKGLLMGVDLVKDKAVLDAAYNDALGVTAAFTRNVLLNVNRILRSDFALDDWQHCSYFHAPMKRVETYVEAKREVVVRWGQGERRFRKGDRIHIENSYKFQPEDVCALLKKAGFKVQNMWFDSRKWFMICYAKPV